MKAQVLIISPQDDLHALAVKYRVKSIFQHDIKCEIFDSATFPIASELTWTFENKKFIPVLRISRGLSSHASLDAAQVLLKFDKSKNIPFRITDGTSVWYRRFRRPILYPEVELPELKSYCMLSLLASVKAALNSCTVINQTYAEDQADLKPLQLFHAKKVGLRIPETLISTDKDEIKVFLLKLKSQGKEVVFKDLGNLVIGYSTRKIDLTFFKRSTNYHLSPCIFQERIQGGVDLRIVVLDNLIFTCEWRSKKIGKNIVDIRDEDDAKMWPSECPVEIKKKLLKLHKKLGLTFGVYDFKIDANGNSYFLEVNPSGQWLNMEIQGKQQISEAFAKFLVNGVITAKDLSLPPLHLVELNEIADKSFSVPEKWVRVY